MKKLKFHTPDKEGKSKCHKIHVGRDSKFCPQLKVHGTTMETVQGDTYLGDVVSGDGKNTKNVQKRISKGLGIISSIMNLLDKICFGIFYFEMAILLRESMFLNGILTNCEIWHNVQKKEIEDLEELDRSLLHKILKVPFTTPNESLYLELGIIPIGSVIKARRIMYLYYLLNLEKTEMLYKFFIIQWGNPTRGDWSELVKEDLTDFKVGTNLDNIRMQRNHSLKKLVKERAKDHVFETLITKKDDNSKMDNLKYTELKQQEYTKSPNLRLEENLNIFKFRTCMAEFGENFRAGADYVFCLL